MGELRIPSMKLMKCYVTINSHAKNPIHHNQTKHVEIDRHFTKEIIGSRALSLWHIQSYHQNADIFTKALPKKTFKELSFKPNLLDIFNIV